MKAKLMFLMAIILVCLSISSACASDVDNQTIQSIDQITPAAGAIYNIMQDIKGLSVLNSNLMHGEYIINSLYKGFNVSNKLTMV